MEIILKQQEEEIKTLTELKKEFVDVCNEFLKKNGVTNNDDNYIDYDFKVHMNCPSKDFIRGFSLLFLLISLYDNNNLYIDFAEEIYIKFVGDEKLLKRIITYIKDNTSVNIKI